MKRFLTDRWTWVYLGLVVVLCYGHTGLPSL